MQVIAGRIAGAAHITDQIALIHIFACTGSYRTHVPVQGGVGIAIGHFAVVDDNVVAVAAGGPACHLHIAAGGCVDGRAAGGCKVDTGMELVHAGNGVLAPAVLTGNTGVTLQRAGKAAKAQLRLAGRGCCDQLLDFLFHSLVVHLVGFNGCLCLLLCRLCFGSRELCRRDAAVQLALLALHLGVLAVQLALLALQFCLLGFQTGLLLFQRGLIVLQPLLGGLHVVHDLGVLDGDILHHLVEGKQLVQVVHRTQHGHAAAVPQLLHGSHVLFKIVPLVVDLVLLLLDLGLLVRDLALHHADLLFLFANVVLHRGDLAAEHTDLILQNADPLLQLAFQRLGGGLLLFGVRQLLFVLIDGLGELVQLSLQTGHAGIAGSRRGRVHRGRQQQADTGQPKADRPDQLVAGAFRPGVPAGIRACEPEGLCVHCFTHKTRLLSVTHSDVYGERTYCPRRLRWHR